MSMNWAISILTALITALFAMLVFARFRRSGGWHLLAWGVGLALYSLGAAAQAFLFNDFDTFMFKLWYWAGAVAVAPWLGQGTIFLLVKRRSWAWFSFWQVLMLTLLGLFIVLLARVDPAAYRPGVDMTEQFQDIFAATGGAKTARTLLVIFLNTYGTLFLVGGALYSAYMVWRKRARAGLMWGNILIAGGGLLPAMGGYLILMGRPDYKYMGQLLGSVLLFLGFLVVTRGDRQSSASANPFQSNNYQQ